MSATDTPGGVAVVTGASRGIGAAVARGLAQRGMVVACVATSTASSNDIVAELAASGAMASAFGVDVADPAAVDRAFDEIEEQLGTITALVNSAGIAQVAPFVDVAASEFTSVVAVNLYGTFYCSQAAARRMIRAGTKGSIVTVGSVTGESAFPGRSGYCASKAAVHHLTKVMAIELAHHQIRVNCVAPGYIATELVLDLVADGKVDEKALLQRIPVHALGGTADVADAIIFLLSDAASYITGSVLMVDGGWTAYGFT